MEYGSENYTEHTTYSNAATSGKRNLPTALFGFEKKSVISHIDSLYRNAAEQERRLLASIENLSAKNKELENTISDYEHKLSIVKSQFEAEKSYNVETRQREDMFKQAIQALQEKIGELEKGDSDLSSTNEQKFQIANKIIAELRSRLSTQDGTIQALKTELAHREQIISEREDELKQQEAELEEKKREVRRQSSELTRRTAELAGREKVIANYTETIREKDKEISEKDARLFSKESEISALKNRIEQLEAEIREIEAQREEISSALENAKSQVNSEGEDGSLEGRILKQITYYSERADLLRAELDKFGKQISAFEDYIYHKWESDAAASSSSASGAFSSTESRIKHEVPFTGEEPFKSSGYYAPEYAAVHAPYPYYPGFMPPAEPRVVPPVRQYSPVVYPVYPPRPTARYAQPQMRDSRTAGYYPLHPGYIYYPR